jgi:hypothetical protein
MAKQLGVIHLRGTIGDVTYRKTQNGHIAQKKTSLTKERVETDPAFANSRRSSHEFGTAAKGAGILRRVFREGIQHCYDRDVQGRLTKRLQSVIEGDTICTKGERNLVCGDLLRLKDFWWNKNTCVASAIAVKYSVEVDRQGGKVSFLIPALIPDDRLKANPSATHYRIIASAAEVNWLEGNYATVNATDYMKVGRKENDAFTAVIPIKQGSTVPIVSSLAICWYQEIAGEMNVLKDKYYNTAGVVDVNVWEE